MKENLFLQEKLLSIIFEKTSRSPMLSWFGKRKKWKEQEFFFLQAARRLKSYIPTLDQEEAKALKLLFSSWKEELCLRKDLPRASSYLEQLRAKHPILLASPPLYWRLGALALNIFLVIVLAAIFRQCCVEQQKIPSGSMRSTFLELDHVLVSKTAYGLNDPTALGHIISPSSRLRRGDLVTFTSQNIPGIDSDSLFLYKIPIKKRLVKRLMALPGDRVYFYGGIVWTLSKEGLLARSDAIFDRGKNDEYIPFQFPKGTIQRGFINETRAPIYLIKHFNQYIASVSREESGTWQPRNLNSLLPNPEGNLLEPWGMHNYAHARLLLRRQHFYSVAPSDHVGDAPFLMELSHHPSFTQKAQANVDAEHPYYLHRSLLPITQEAAERLMAQMTTSRFTLKEGRISRYELDPQMVDHGFDLLPPALPPGHQEGTFEFERGTLYAIAANGARSEVNEHPLLEMRYLPMIFNCGIEWNKEHNALPSPSPLLLKRYAYYREGDLYCMGAPLYEAGDEVLERFIAQELERKEESAHYPAFLDEEAPTKQRIESQGLEVKEKEVLVLGDNHALSGDSRFFGTIPIRNIEGRPVAKIWPTSSMRLELEQPPIATFNLPTLVAYGLILGIYLVARAYHRRPLKTNFFKR